LSIKLFAGMITSARLVALPGGGEFYEMLSFLFEKEALLFLLRILPYNLEMSPLIALLALAQVSQKSHQNWRMQQQHR